MFVLRRFVRFAVLTALMVFMFSVIAVHAQEPTTLNI